jgi:hypothetical protein
MNVHHVIRADFNDGTDDEPLYWSNDDGWVALSTATVFSTEEKNGPLPLESRDWMTVGEAIEERTTFERKLAEEELA